MNNAGMKLYGHNGGVWEWTSSEFAGRNGFVPSVIYPGYSADFYDGKHFVVVSSADIRHAELNDAARRIIPDDPEYRWSQVV